jgi:ubiquitin
MSRKLSIALLLAAVFAGCAGETEQPQGSAVSIAPAGAADRQVLVASVPPGATVILKGAPVGETPMKLLVRDETNLILEKEGYVRQAVLITPTSDPNLVVELEPAGEEGAAEEPAEVDPGEASEGPVAGKAAGSSKKKPSGDATKTEPGPEKAPADPVAPEPAPEPEAKTPPASSGGAKDKVYTTMRQLKDDLAKGIITRDDYRKWQAEIRKKRAADLEALERDLRERKITKAEYEAKAREIKLKYEG